MHNANNHYHPFRQFNQSEKAISVVLSGQTDIQDTYITNLVSSAPISVYDTIGEGFIEITDTKPISLSANQMAEIALEIIEKVKQDFILNQGTSNSDCADAAIRWWLRTVNSILQKQEQYGCSAAQACCFNCVVNCLTRLLNPFDPLGYQGCLKICSAEGGGCCQKQNSPICSTLNEMFNSAAEELQKRLRDCAAIQVQDTNPQPESM